MATAAKVNEIYKNLLGRAADKGGLQYWSSFNDVNAIKAGIKSSDEYRKYQAELARKATMSKAPTKYQPFTSLLPFDKVFNNDLITGLAESQINPEIERARSQDVNQLQKGAAASGAYRSGFLPTQTNRLGDMYERQRKEQVEQFTGSIKDLANNWYTDQMEAYGKNPSRYVMPTIPTWDQFMNQNPNYSNIYNNVIGNTQTTYKSPFNN